MAPRMARSMDELNTMATQNARVDGYGLEIAQFIPCPCCGTADCLKLMPAQMAMQGERSYAVTGSCGRCGRTFEVRVNRSEDGSEVSGGFVLVGGDPAPEWLQPPIPTGEPTEGALSW